MPPKQKVSNKTVDKAKSKIIEDKTFGLKNKNRSAKVQAYIHQVSTSVKSSSKADKDREKERDQKKEAKLAKLAFEAELEKLFKADQKPRETNEDDEEADKNLGVNPEDYLWRPEDFEDVEADDTRLEEKLEQEREALKLRTDLTPVTEETFRAWRQRKIQEKEDAERKRIAAAKAKGAGLRGWDLWQHDQSLFVDDEDAEELYEREEQEEEEEAEATDEDEDEGEASATAKHVDPTAE